MNPNVRLTPAQRRKKIERLEIQLEVLRRRAGKLRANNTLWTNKIIKQNEDAEIIRREVQAKVQAEERGIADVLGGQEREISHLRAAGTREGVQQVEAALRRRLRNRRVILERWQQRVQGLQEKAAELGI